jgi:ankyrin repeat protein
MAPLHNAAARGNLSEVRRLINAGENVNARNNQSMTPLMHAAMRGHANVIRHLLNRGASARLRRNTNNTRSAIHYAIENGHVNAVRALVRHSNLQAQNGNGRNPLTIAAGLHHPEIVRILIRSGARPNNMTNEYLANNTNKNRRNLVGASLVKWSIAKRTIPATLRAGMKARKNRNLAMRQQLSGMKIQTGSSTVKGLPRELQNIIGKMVRGRS